MHCALPKQLTKMPIGGTSSPERVFEAVDVECCEKKTYRRLKLSRKSLSSSNLRTDDRGWTPLHIACKAGDLKEVCRLLDTGVDANEASQGPKAPGATPLHLAASGGHVEVMDLLLERGANIEARTKGACGWTPLHHAAKERNRKAIRFLLENGAFLAKEISDLRFNPPLHYCPGLEYAYMFSKKLERSID